ncbi:MAG: chaperone modulator CbpM [Spirochaetota bacterium]|nr:chaperone modulator CbpM [Spirochaetota bacterium]
MKDSKYDISIYSSVRLYSSKKVISIDEISNDTEIHPHLIKKFVDLGIISPEPVEGNILFFDEDTIFRIKRIQRLRNELGVNLIGAGIICDLVDEIDDLKREIENLKTGSS